MLSCVLSYFVVGEIEADLHFVDKLFIEALRQAINTTCTPISSFIDREKFLVLNILVVPEGVLCMHVGIVKLSIRFYCLVIRSSTLITFPR